MAAYSPVKVKSIKPVKDHVIVTNMEFKERMVGSLVLLSDNGKSSGVRPRWAQVFAVGKDQHDVKIGQWVLVDHGRWTRGIDIETPDGQIHTIRRVDNNDILMVSDSHERPQDETVKDGLSSSH